MKRSRINTIIAEGDAFMRAHGVILPPFAYWDAEKLRSEDAAMIRDRGLG
ncbi:MAG: D-lyxose/D-mannose family sugar isomerase, partial [Pseudomonadota bacterium]